MNIRKYYLLDALHNILIEHRIGVTEHPMITEAKKVQAAMKKGEIYLPWSDDG